MANLLALDQSSYTTGYTVFINEQPVVISHYTASSDDLGKRLLQLRTKIIALIKQYDITEVVFEDIQLQDVGGSKEIGIKTFKILAEVFGVLSELFTELKIKHTAIPPIIWKSTFKIAGKGRAQEKKMAQQYILNNYSIQCTEDEADATCIGLHYLKKQQSEFDWS